MFWGFAKRPHMGYNIFICESAAILAERGQTMAEKQDQQLMKLEGVVEHVIYENAESGYAVFEVDAGGTDVVVAGNVGGVDNGMSVTVYGHMVNHPSYGEQFKAETIEASLPEDTSAILSYLSSGVLPYIGPSTAKKLVAKFGEDTLNVIAQTPQKLCELKGINEQKAAIISNEFRRMYGVREVVAWFARYGLTAQQAVTAYRAFGPHTVEALTQNPYLLCGEPLQLKFGQVDGIAAALQFETGCRLRVAAINCSIPRQSFCACRPMKSKRAWMNFSVPRNCAPARLTVSSTSTCPTCSVPRKISPRGWGSCPPSRPRCPRRWTPISACWKWPRALSTRRCKSRPSSWHCPAA